MENNNGKNLSVNGYLFENIDDYNDAVNEKKGIKYLSDQVDYNDINKTLKIYNEINDKKMFKTPIGIDYLKKMRSELLKSTNEGVDLPYVNVPTYRDKTATKVVKQMTEDDKKDAQKNINKYRHYFNMSLIACAVLVTMIVVMFYVTTKSDSPNILNYEKALQNKYADTATELNAMKQEQIKKQNELNEKERELQSIEESINSQK